MEATAHSTGRAVIFEGKGKPFHLTRRPVPDPGYGEVLVRNLYTTICGSDLHTYCGRRQEPSKVVLGHEIVGEVVKIGPGHSGLDLLGRMIEPGDRVTWSIFATPPGTLPPRKDLPQKSPGLFKYGHALVTDEELFHGGLADFCILKGDTGMIILGTEIPLPIAATINCAHATVAGALRVAGPITHKRVLVMGAGMLGLSCIAMCREAGAAWVAVMDKTQSRLDIARDFHADATLLGVEEHAAPGGQEFDIVFDLTGSPLAMEYGLDRLAIGGVAVWIGAVFPADQVRVNAENVVRKVLQIRGLHNYNLDDLAEATRFIEKHHRDYPFLSSMGRSFPLEQTEVAFEHALDSSAARVGIDLRM